MLRERREAFMNAHGIGEFMYNSKYNDKMLKDICLGLYDVPKESPFAGGLVIDKFYADILIKPLLKEYYACEFRVD